MMKKPTRPQMRPGRLEKMMPGDELPSTQTVEPAISPKARPTLRPKARPADMEERGAVERGNRGSMYEAEDYMIGKEKYAGGGMVRGCKGDQVSGKGFKGTY